LSPIGFFQARNCDASQPGEQGAFVVPARTDEAAERIEMDVSDSAGCRHGARETAERCNCVRAPQSVTGLGSLSADEEVRLAVLLIFCDRPPEECSRLQTLTLRQWRRLLRWLDLSGLALYFFHRVTQIDRAGWLPARIEAALETRLAENTKRTASMLAESIAIQCDFQKAGLRYAISKGLSFWPHSVPRPELRLQFDLDYLLADEDMREAQSALTRRGYRPLTSNERCWKFVRNEQRCLALKDVYKDTGSWAVELHRMSAGSVRRSPLLSLERRELSGFSMPTLCPVDVFLRQGLHCYKDVCSHFFRIAPLIEFYRHVVFYRDDVAFWTALRREAKGNPQAATGLGVVVLLITQVIGEFAPAALTHWTVERLPRPARLWVQTYGRKTVLGSFPGSKLYRLLEKELEPGKTALNPPSQRSSVSARLPGPAQPTFPRESFLARLTRFLRLIPYRIELDLLPGRLRFYGVEGLRLAWESRRWRRLLRQESQ
jgi:hypothetical protein